MPRTRKLINANLPEDELKVSSPISRLSGVGPQTQKLLKRLGVKTVGDLLEYLPSRLEDHSQVTPIKQLRPNEEVVIEVVLEKVSSRQSKRGIFIVQAKVVDDSGSINALWFNQRYLLRYLRPGAKYYLLGQKRLSSALGHPFFVKKIIDKLEVCPIYPTTAGMSQYLWRKLILSSRPALRKFPDPLPTKLRADQAQDGIVEVIDRAHFPKNVIDLEPAKKRLGFDELLFLGLSVGNQRRARRKIKAAKVSLDEEFLRQFVADLPFKLTNGQRQASWQILQDFQSGAPMRRLLYGEVGSGKTAVSAIIIAAILRSKQRVVVLAPTTTLVAQQTARLTEFLGSQGFRVSALTSETKNEFNHSADCVVATHAALHQKELFQNVGLIIVDEQHRFGVNERQALIENWPERHLLLMTATPIPRSLAQSVFGALDITYLLDKPAHQQKVVTKIFPAASRMQIDAEINQRLDRGEPGYVVCPLIETGEDTDDATLFKAERKTVMGEVKRLMRRFPRARIGLLHGRLKEDEKQKIVAQFATGKLDILVSTTVIEVGIDNPNATWILVEDADNFGLSQLHQLRGRVGRGSKPSICLLVESESATQLGQERLKALAQTNDGLAIAEADLRLRGPGELTGLDQSGLPLLKYADWSDATRIKEVFAIAEKLLDDGLDKYPPLRRQVEKSAKVQTDQVA